jgi:hypothetical protein
MARAQASGATPSAVLAGPQMPTWLTRISARTLEPGRFCQRRRANRGFCDIRPHEGTGASFSGDQARGCCQCRAVHIQTQNLGPARGYPHSNDAPIADIGAAHAGVTRASDDGDSAGRAGMSWTGVPSDKVR